MVTSPIVVRAVPACFGNGVASHPRLAGVPTTPRRRSDLVAVSALAATAVSLARKVRGASNGRGLPGARLGARHGSVALRSTVALENAAADTSVGQADRVQLGTLSIPALGVGTLNWPLSKEEGDPDSEEVVKTSLDLGVDFFDTAEAYGFGRCEKLTRACLKKAARGGQVATKFGPVPWRGDADDLVRAAEASAERLGVSSIDLYQIHWPDIIQPLKILGLEERKDELYWEGLARCYQSGLVKNVGVSNYGPTMVQKAFDYLDSRGVPLASNQFNYSLLYRKQNSQATVDKCEELGVKVLAYFPLGMGLLTGKYDSDNRPGGVKGFTMAKYFDGGGSIPAGGVMPLVEKLREVAKRREKTPAQVALNWIICKGAVPIPGARTGQQAADNAQALGWRLGDAEVQELESAADSLGFEFSGGGFTLE